MNIEDTVMEEGLPVNSKAMLNRLNEIMDESKTNCLNDINGDMRVRKILWLLNGQVHGQLATIDMSKEWDRFND